MTTLVQDAHAGKHKAHYAHHLTPNLSSFVFCSGNEEGGIVARQHTLKDMASGARQHELHTYKGFAATAEGDATTQVLACASAYLYLTCVLQESGIQLVSVTTDGDSDIHR